MEKRLITAISLSILVIVLFTFFGKKPQYVEPPSSKKSRESSIAQPVPEPGPQGLAPILPDTETEKTTVETEKYALTFTNLGGSLEDIKLKEYVHHKTNKPQTLVAKARGNQALCAMSSDALIDALDRQTFKVKKERDKLVYTFAIPGKFEISKEYYFHKLNDYIELRISIRNLGKTTIYKHYDLLGASCLESASLSMGRRFVEIDSMVNGKIVKNSKVKNGEEFIEGIVEWTGVKERYFSIILKPRQESEGVILKQFNKKALASGIRSRRSPISPGSATEDSYILYIGPNDIVRLSALNLGLEQIINYGIFGGISKVLLTVLRAFHKVVRNWGVAIIMLTFLINIVLFPLTRKSFTSMRKIQEVQPHIEKLRKLHKDNPQKMNKELAELYRQYNVNPFGGCLPLLVQMPIFIALYQGLMRSIELKGANFLWIKDLSSPDYISLPISLPFIGNQIHILPIIMVGAMFFQQKLSTAHSGNATPEQKQQQKFMLIFFPIFFGFLFYNFPSGLVLYWLTNTILMVIEHSAIRKTQSV